jgi:thiosulfate reductase cytochrome b subunit/nitrate/TMAO reductase-like tetraheme cytochrome c subunit
MADSKFFPFWLRLWHWTNALLYILLIFTGISLHYSASGSFIIPFSISLIVHNISGILLSLSYITFFIINITSGNIKYYKINFKTLLSDISNQIKYYMFDIYDKTKHPHKSLDEKFNVLQKLSYVFILFLFQPLIIISGWLLLFPELAPREFFGMGGVWPMAISHIVIGFIVSLFTIAHIYLGSTGKTALSLYKTMITGEEAEEELEEEIIIEPIGTTVKTKERIFPSFFYNPITLTGALLTLVSSSIFIFLFIIELFFAKHNPYMGIITFIATPFFIIVGIAIIIIGLIRENRRYLRSGSKGSRLPVIDFNNPKHQVSIIVFTVFSLFLLVFSTLGSFKAYEYTESDEFCGQLCHSVMEPEFTTYQRSPHNRVGCVKCHIGQGADWFVKAKISGLYQVYAVLTNSYSRPIPTPVENLRPAPETCEQCHWPKYFYDEKVKKNHYFLPDEHNSEVRIEMSIKVGGGNIEVGNTSGIHWNMNLANEITYYASDRSRTDIPWIKVKNRMTGKETVYSVPGSQFDPVSISANKLKTFDCIDCHNRPSHNYYPPNELVNLFLSLKKIDPTVPFIKLASINALEENLTNEGDVYEGIRGSIFRFYEGRNINLTSNMKSGIDKAIESLSEIQKKNSFPKMKANWTQFPNNIGHIYTMGCFRCHDGKHVSPEGKVVSNDCNTCHSFKSEVIPLDSTQTSKIEDRFIHPAKLEKGAIIQNCYYCHGVRRDFLLEKEASKATQ